MMEQLITLHMEMAQIVAKHSGSQKGAVLWSQTGAMVASGETPETVFARAKKANVPTVTGRLYLSFLPDPDFCDHIAAAGISVVHFFSTPDDMSGIDKLISMGTLCVRYDQN